MVIQVKRVYDRPEPADGYRVLVERLWPRGMIRERAWIDLWVPDAGASPHLRKWFSHHQDQWDEFRQRYFDELSGRPALVRMLVRLAGERPVVTFLFTGHDKERNGAVVLKTYLDELVPVT